jgi:hypothetical protein
VETEKIDEQDLILHALLMSERIKLRQLYNSLEIATSSRRELNKYFDEAINEATAQRDALILSKLQRLQKTLDNPPNITRTLDQATVDLVLEVWTLHERFPDLTLKDIVIKHFGGISEYDRIRKAVQRVRKARKKAKSVP